MPMSESDVAIIKEAPPKPTRIRTSTNNSAKSGFPEITIGTMTHESLSPVAKTPVPLPRPAPKRPTLTGIGGIAPSEPCLNLGGQRNRNRMHAEQKVESKARQDVFSKEAGMPVRTAPALHGLAQRASAAPLPPPKPKRISVAPQPKAKPLSLQSIPLQPKVDASTRSTASPIITPTIPFTTTTAIPSTAQSSFSLNDSGRMPVNTVYAQEPIRPGTTPSSPHVSSPSSVRKPRSAERSSDGSLVQSESRQQRVRINTTPAHLQVSTLQKSENTVRKKSITAPSSPENRVSSTTASSPASVGTNPTLLGARSRLRSTSDAKVSTSPATMFPQTSRCQASSAQASDGLGLGFGGGILKEHTVTVLPFAYPPPQHELNGGHWDTMDDPQSTAVAGASLTASLHKIQALAHEQTERMKQINYAEKKSDIAEVVFEKSSIWRARGAEWGGLAKKAWDDRGGMGGIAGGIADRLKRRDRIFGLPLEDAVKFSKISASTGVPAVVTRCIEYLDVMGVEEVGLYRVSGSTTNVARLKAIFDQGHDYDFLQKGNEPQNPHDVATLLKLYLRELPWPIIPQDVMPTLNNIDFADLNRNPLERLKEALRLLPLENYILLGTLCQHLSNLADYETYTKMNISNLGLIFCPTLQIGSILFKNLLGGDGSEEERRKTLLLVWGDLDSKHGEMENLEMIKDFEMGLDFEKNGDHTFQDDSSQEQERAKEEHTRLQEKEPGRRSGSWEEVDRDLLNFTSPSPPNAITLSSQLNTCSVPNGTMDSTSTIDNHSNPPAPEPVMDLYDELMTRELNEATNTPLVDLGLDDEPDEAEVRWRRHAREPAINRYSDDPPSRGTRHERLPAMSLRY
ncbi:hypothetical protein BG011_008909 [Mortierella polycephala]|uniref:Rho-GAP domain-containing protein n=1 Tax=Mortierella polycephala TaxID=41804 RepID=A0A9P6PNV4_9FUNG|nr:hypothetical protein BG011_008909 [Mortierella polycephala]